MVQATEKKKTRIVGHATKKKKTGIVVQATKRKSVAQTTKIQNRTEAEPRPPPPPKKAAEAGGEYIYCFARPIVPFQTLPGIHLLP